MWAHLGDDRMKKRHLDTTFANAASTRRLVRSAFAVNWREPDCQRCG